MTSYYCHIYETNIKNNQYQNNAKVWQLYTDNTFKEVYLHHGAK